MQRFVGKNVRIQRPRKNFSKEVATKSYVKKQISRQATILQVSGSGTSASVSYDSPLVANLTGATNEGYQFKSPLQLRLRFKGKSGAITAVRCIVFQWLVSNQQAPTVPDLLISANATAVEQPFNYDNRAMYKVMYDSYFLLGDTASSDDIPDEVVRSINIPLKRLQRKTQIPTDDAGSYSKGNIYMMVLSDIANASTPPTISSYYSGISMLTLANH